VCILTSVCAHQERRRRCAINIRFVIYGKHGTKDELSLIASSRPKRKSEVPLQPPKSFSFSDISSSALTESSACLM